jgi:hypothetical protein
MGLPTEVVPFDSYSGPVSAIALRLHPLDVGYDLRGEGTPVALPPGVTVASYARRNGRRYVVTGTPDAVAAELRAAGYKLV